MTEAAAKPRFAAEEYLRLETAAEQKHEYHAGEILATSGGTVEHSRITTNIIGGFRLRLKGTSCFPLDSNIKVRLAEDNRYVQPDVTIVWGEAQVDPRDRNRTSIINPKVVIEVLSESTEAYDRGTKFTAYRNLPSLDEYVLVSQGTPLMETFVRQPDANWLFAASLGLEAKATLLALKIDLPLAELYAGISFAGSGDAAITPTVGNDEQS